MGIEDVLVNWQTNTVRRPSPRKVTVEAETLKQVREGRGEENQTLYPPRQYESQDGGSSCSNSVKVTHLARSLRWHHPQKCPTRWLPLVLDFVSVGSPDTFCTSHEYKPKYISKR